MVPWPGTAGAAAGAGGSSYIANQRAAMFAELDRDPALRTTVMNVIETEMGGGGVGSTAVLESMVNRAQMRGYSSLRTAVNDGFYGPVNRGEVARRNLSDKERADMERTIATVRGGSNVTDWRTDQGMINEHRGRTGIKQIGGEYFSYHDEAGWSRRQAEQMREYDARVGSGVGGVTTGRAIPFLTGKEETGVSGSWLSSVAPDRSALDGAMGREAGKVEGQGNLNVTVTDKRGVGEQKGTENLFHPVPTERMTQHEPAKQGPSKPESTPDPIDLPEVEIKGGDRGGDED